MKKFIALILAMLMVLCVSGCGTEIGAVETMPPETLNNVTQPEQNSAEPTNSNQTEIAGTNSPALEETETSEPPKPEPPIEPTPFVPVDLDGFYKPDGSYDLVAACEQLGYRFLDGYARTPDGYYTYRISFRHAETRDQLVFYGASSTSTFMDIYVRTGDTAVRYLACIWHDELRYRFMELNEFDLDGQVKALDNPGVIVFTDEAGENVTLPAGTMRNILTVLEKSVDGSRGDPFSAMSYGSYQVDNYHIEDSDWRPDSGVEMLSALNQFSSYKRVYIP